MSSFEDERNSKDNIYALKPSTLENIDAAVFKWLKNDIEAHTKTNEGWKPVPVIWAGEERVYQFKKDRDIRDKIGALVFPLMTIRRTSKSKSMSSKGAFQADTPAVDSIHEGVIPFRRKINQNKTSNFEVADVIKKSEGNRINFKTQKKNNDPIYETLYLPQPIYIDINYQVVLRSDFQQQMNDMVTPFVNYSGAINHFMVENNGWSYECFFEEDFSEDNNSASFDEEERTFKTAIDIRTLGYLIGDGDNQKGSEITIKENAVSVTVEENIITGSL